jgi:hypothetical protein
VFFLGFELRASYLQGKPCYYLRHTSSPICSDYLGDRGFFLGGWIITGIWTLGFMLAWQVLYYLSHATSQGLTFCWGQQGPHWSYFKLPAITTPSFFSIEMGSYKLFCPGWPKTVILPISSSQVARITGVSHRSIARCFVIAKPNGLIQVLSNYSSLNKPL